MISRYLVWMVSGAIMRTVGPRDRDSSTTFSRQRPDQGWYPMEPRGRSKRKLFMLIGLALAAILVVAGTVAFEAQLAGHPQKTGSGVPSGGTPGASTATAAPTVATFGQPGKWDQVGPAFAQRAVIAESSPATMYTCGYQAPAGSAGNTGPVSLAVTHDGGLTWQTLPTPAHGAYCDVRVSTTNPSHVAIQTMAVCGQESCTSNDPPQLNVSLDGGVHWSPASLPAGNGGATQPSTTFAWAGDTLFVFAIGAGAGSHSLAASTNGGAFTWVDQNLTGLPAGATPISGEMRAAGNTLYWTFTAGSCLQSSTSCIVIARTSDGGATWTHVTPAYAGSAYAGLTNIRIVASALGAPLIGFGGTCQCTEPPLLRSTDGGATWHELPRYSTGQRPSEFFTAETPDGTVYATLTTNDSVEGIYVLAPGATTWNHLTYPSGINSWELADASWDANGHPKALWGWAWQNDQSFGLWHYPV